MSILLKTKMYRNLEDAYVLYSTFQQSGNHKIVIIKFAV